MCAVSDVSAWPASGDSSATSSVASEAAKAASRRGSARAPSLRQPAVYASASASSPVAMRSSAMIEQDRDHDALGEDEQQVERAEEDAELTEEPQLRRL